MIPTIHFVGLDVHKESVAVSLAPYSSTKVRHYGTIGRRMEYWDRVIKKSRAPRTRRSCVSVTRRGQRAIHSASSCKS